MRKTVFLKHVFLAIAMLAISLPSWGDGEGIPSMGQSWVARYQFVENWENATDPTDGSDTPWYSPGFNDTSWPTLTGLLDGNNWNAEYSAYYLRSSFTMPEVKDGSYILIVNHDDLVRIYLNGTFIGEREECGTQGFVIPSGLLTEGENLLAIYIDDRGGGGRYLDYGLRLQRVLTAQTIEGVDMTFTVISENEKTCMVGDEIGESSSPFPSDYIGGITIPSVVNGYTVTRIGKWAFSRRGGLTSVTIPETVESIGTQAFNFTGLTAITLPRNLKTIEDGVFQGCTGITSITIPASVTSIADITVDAATNLASIEVESGNQVYDSRYDCNAIIETATNSLIQGCKNSVIPNSVTNIADGAFIDCTGLTSIDIPSSVTSIGNRAFFGCSNLASVSLPENLETIDGDAFGGCESLTSIVIPASVTSIGDYIFAGCIGLTSIVVEDGNTVYDCRDNSNAIIETSSNTLILGCQNTTIPSSVTSIGEWAFHGCSDLTAIFLPSNLKTIESFAFNCCSSLTSITIPEGVTSIGHGAFDGCSNLTSVTVCNGTPVSISENPFSDRANATLYVPAGSKADYEAADYWKDFKAIKEIGADVVFTAQNPEGVDMTFKVISENEKTCMVGLEEYGVASITETYNGGITIPSEVNGYTVKRIGNWAFLWRGDLTSVSIIPNTVESIGTQAFNFTGLNSIAIPASVTSIESDNFRHCSGLTSITVEPGNSYYDSRNDCNAIIEKGTNELIAGCKNTIIPSDVTSIGNEAFRGNGLISITIPNSVTSIGNFTFAECPELTSITIPYSVTNIGINPFYLSNNMVSITVESGNPYCDSRDDCNALIETATNKLIAGCKNTIIPSDVTSIGDYAFTGFGLTSITIPNSVTSIGTDAFRGNDLTSINIPEGVTSIENGAFSECPNLTLVTVNNPNPISLSEDQDLGFDRGNVVLYVPAGRIDAYANANYWRDFKAIKEIGADVVFTAQTIEGVDMTFSVISESEKTCMVGLEEDGVASITETYNGGITIPSVVNGYTVKRIGKWAFSERGGLTSVSIPETVESIGTQAFFSTGLTEITLPSNLKTIEDCAFQGCTGITSVTIPASVTSIADGAFDAATNLASIEVESGNQVYDSRYGCNAIIEKATNSLIQGCKNSVIPNSVTNIADGAFIGCTGLTSIDIPSSVTSIGHRAFYYTGLTSITIPSGAENFNGGALTGCTELTSIVVESGNTVYDCRDNCNAIIESSTNTLIAGCKNTIIPNTVTRIGSEAFYDHNEITTFEIPSSVTSIGDQAFRGCGLTSINIPEGVTSIEFWAFGECHNLTSVTVNNPNPISLSEDQDLGFDRGNAVLYVPAGRIDAYANANYWKDFKEIKEIGADVVFTAQTIEGVDMTFTVINENEKTCMVGIEEYGVASITETYNGGITIPSEVNGYTVKRIGKWALCGRGGLTSVSIPETVESIGTQAFNFTGLTAITLPSNLKTIEDGVFQGCTGITSVTIPASVTSIAVGTFDDANLASIKVENGNQVYDSRNDCNAIIETATNTLVIGCQNTAIPDDVEIIGTHAFVHCYGLESITIPSSVKSIGGRAFFGCSNLASVSLPENLETIDGDAFGGCESLTSIVIPASVTSIGDYIFAGCRGLTSIVVEDGNTVYDCRDNCNAIIETSTNTLIAGCKNTIIPNTVTCIGNGAFNDLTNLTSIEIPSSVTTLKWWAFHDCGLTSINIPAAVTTIEAGAFEACDNLTSVTVNNPVPVDLSCGGIHTSYVFSNYANTTLYVPAGSKSAYENADYWKDFKEIKEIVSVTDISQMDNVIYIEPVEARSGSELTLSVKMKNNVEMESFGFDMVLPEGITVATDVDGYAMAELSTERTSTRKTNVFGADFKEDGSLNVQAYSTNGSTISGYDGEIALITIKLASDLIAGDYPILLKNIAMADAGAVTYRVESVTCKLTVPAYKLGDANSDGYVDVGDLTAISHKILNRPDESFNPKAADANEDSSIDVGDLTAVSHIILWGSVQRPQNAPKKRQEPMIEPE